MVTSTVSPLADFLFGRTRQSVLALFFTHPNERFHLRQVQRLTGCGTGPVQRELAAQLAAGLLIRQREGVQTYYALNANIPAFAEFRALVLKTAGAPAIVNAALAPLTGQIVAACIFGSMAADRLQGQSDIDLLLVSDTLDLPRLVEVLAPAQKTLGREINPVLYTRKEFDQKRRTKAFLQRVLAGPRIHLLGDPHVFE